MACPRRDVAARTPRALVAVFAVEGTSSLGQGIINVLWLVYLRTVLGGGPLEYGVIQTAVGVVPLLNVAASLFVLAGLPVFTMPTEDRSPQVPAGRI